MIWFWVRYIWFQSSFENIVQLAQLIHKKSNTKIYTKLQTIKVSRKNIWNDKNQITIEFGKIPSKLPLIFYLIEQNSRV